MADIFELSLKLTAAGLTELQAGLERVNALGGQAASVLTQAEQASQAFAAANAGLATSASAANAASTALGQALAQVGQSAQAAAAGAQEVQSGFGVAAPSVATMVDLITRATTGFGSVSEAAVRAAEAESQQAAAAQAAAEAAAAQAQAAAEQTAATEALTAAQALAIERTAGLISATEGDAAAKALGGAAYRAYYDALVAAEQGQLGVAGSALSEAEAFNRAQGSATAFAESQAEITAGVAATDAAMAGARGQWASGATAMQALAAQAREVKADLAAGLTTESEATARLAQLRAEAIALRQELGTLSATSAGTFNQILRATSTETGVATSALEGMNTRGLFQVARGMAFMEAASVGAGRGVSQLALGAFLFAGNTWFAVAALAALGVGVAVYELLTGAQQKLDAEFDTAFKKFADNKAGADALGDAYIGLAEAIDRATTARERLSEITTPIGTPPGQAAAVLGPEAAGALHGAQEFGGLGPLGEVTGAIAGYIGVVHEKTKAEEADQAAIRATNTIQTEQIAGYQKQAATLRDLIAQGSDVTANRQRLRDTESQLTTAVQAHTSAVQQQNLSVFGQIASLPELIAARQREIDTIIAQVKSEDDLDAATRKHLSAVREELATLQTAYGLTGAAAKLMADDAKAAAALIAETGKVFGQTAADISLLFELGLISGSKLAAVEQAYEAAAKNTNLPLEQRRQAHQAAQQIEQLLLSTERDRLAVIGALGKGDGESATTVKALTAEYARLQQQIETGNAKAAAQAVGQQDAVRKAIAAPLEGVIQRANDAAEAVKVFGATAGDLSALRVAVAALTGLTDDDNRALLASVGLQSLETQALKARTAALQELAVATEVMTEAGAAREAPSFGLGGVTKGPTGAPITFGQGISLAPAQQAALIPERPLTPEVPFGAGGLPPLIPGNFFDQSIQTLTQGFARINAVTKTGVQAVNASMTHAATDLAKSFESALRSAFESIVTSIGQLIGNLFVGVDTSGFGKEILAALGGLFVKMGEAMIAASPIFKALAAAMSNPFTAGPALLAYGVALVALGSLLGAIATGMGGGGGAGAGGAASNTPIRVIVVDTATRAAAGVQQPQPFYYAPNMIGVNDVQAQAQLAEMQRQWTRRNRPTGI
jgi:hypothetical protein